MGTFYKPPNASPIVLSDIEHSRGLAVYTGIENLIITVDLNLNILNPYSRNKVMDICQT